MHPFRAGYRTPQPRQKLILVLSALAGVIVAGIYMCVATPRRDVPAPHARGNVGRHGNVSRHAETPEEFAFGVIVVVLFFGTTYATGMALYRHFGDTEGYTVVSANAGQHMPLLFLVAGGAMADMHGTNVYGGRGRVIDWLLLAIGIGLLAIAVWGRVYAPLFPGFSGVFMENIP